MLKKMFDTTKRNYQKLKILYLLLIISNIILFAGLAYYYSAVEIGVEIKFIDNLLTVLATIIVLAFVSVRLPRLRERGGSLYDVGYLIIITMLGLVTSYFNGAVNMPMLFRPYLDMFKVLSVILIFMLLAAKMKPLREILYGEHTKRNQAVCFIIFAILGIFASRFHIFIDGAPANVRCMVVMISGLLGGPFVGIPVGLISGAYRYALGGVTALPCSISTLMAGIIGSLVFVWNDRKYPRTFAVITLVFLFIGFEMLVVVVMTPPNISFPFIASIYPVVLFASVVGSILFSMLIREERQKMGSRDLDEDDWDEVRTQENEEVEKLKDEISQLKEESAESKRLIEDLKNEIGQLKK